jgi:hypothetical protein
MRANYRRPLLKVEVFALVVLGFVLYPALTLFPNPFFGREVHGKKIPLYDSRLQHQLPVCRDTWLLIVFDYTNSRAESVSKTRLNPSIIPQRTEVSHETFPTLELHHFGSCGGVRPPGRKRGDDANYVSRDPGFVLPEQFPTYGETPRQQTLTGRRIGGLDHPNQPIDD